MDSSEGTKGSDQVHGSRVECEKLILIHGRHTLHSAHSQHALITLIRRTREMSDWHLPRGEMVNGMMQIDRYTTTHPINVHSAARWPCQNGSICVKQRDRVANSFRLTPET